MHLSVIRPYSTGRGAGVEGQKGPSGGFLEEDVARAAGPQFLFAACLVSFSKLCLFVFGTFGSSIYCSDFL